MKSISHFLIPSPYNVYGFINEDIMCLITQNFRARDLDAVSRTCHHFEKLTCNAVMWRSLLERMPSFKDKLKDSTSKEVFSSAFLELHPEAVLSKIYFYCENRYAKVDLPKAVELVDFLGDDTIIMDESIRIKALVKKAELLVGTHPNFDERNETVKDIVDELIESDTLGIEYKGIAEVLKGKLGYYENGDVMDDEACRLLAKGRVDQNIPYTVRIEAGMYDCLMAFHGRKSSFSKKEAFDWLGTIILDSAATIEQRALAALYQVELLCEEGMFIISNKKWVELLSQVLSDLDISEKTRMKALLLFAIMHFQNRTLDIAKVNITNDIAFNYLEEVKNSEEAEEKDRYKAILYQAKYFYHCRTTNICDKIAFECLVKVDENPALEDTIRYEATLYQAISQYERKKGFITDEKAMELLTEILEDDQSGRFDAIAAIYKSLMHFSKRTQVINDAKALELLELVATDEKAEEHVKARAREILKIKGHLCKDEL
ncbi:MAG: hypothetical protein H0V82_02830 [Candidatus Protochlamydia sp.]|nr:hypothetical protein [Candidatus Protochlamydia sp.]